MEQLIVPCLIFILVTSIFRYFLKYQHYYRLAFNLPGAHPFIPSMLAGILFAPFYKFDAYQIFRRLQGTSDDLYTVWFPQLVVVVKNPEFLTKYFTLIDKSIHYKGVSYLIGEVGLITCGGDVFRKSKQIFLRDFNASSQEIILDNIYEGTEKLVKTLEKNVGQGWFKLADVIKFTTTNNILGGAMGMKFSEEHEIFKLAKEFDHITKLALLKITLLSVFPFLSYIFPFEKKLQKARSAAEAFANEICTKKRKDFQEIIAENEEVPNQFIYNILRDRADDPIENAHADIITVAAAALDTSAITAAAALVLLGMYPEAQEKVFQEDQIVRQELGGRKMIDSNFNKYEYLNRVIKETLRLYSSIPMIAKHVPEDLELGKYIVPKGCTIAVNLRFIHRNPAIYPNPSKFDPDRFLPENVEKRHKYAYMPFSHGQRQCPGLRYATQSAIFIVSSVIRKFEVFSKYKSVEEIDDHITGFITLAETGEFPARLEFRNNN